MLNWFFRASVAIAVTIAVMSVSDPLTALAKPAFPKNADLHELKELPVTVTEQGGKLLLSDSPEMVPADGIMYQDTVNGNVRLFFHHVNATTELKKVVVLLVNETAAAADVVVSQYGLGGPGHDYLAVGKKVQLDYLDKAGVELLTVPAKGTALLEPKLNDIIVMPDALVNGMYDFHTKVPLKVVVMMLPVDEDPAEFVKEAEILPADRERLRGSFWGYDRLVVPSQVYKSRQDGVLAITLADHKRDPFVAGIDATDGSPTLNYGNYGVLYKVFLPTVSNQKYAIYFNPRGGEYAGSLRVKYRRQEKDTVGLPADKLFFGSKTVEDTDYIGEYDGGQSLWLTFSPPGASNLPVKIILIPVGKEK